ILSYHTEIVMRHYRLSQDVYVEMFADEAILFVANLDVMLTVNAAAAELFEAARSVLADRPFTRGECTSFLLDTYDMTPDQAERQTLSLLSFGLRNHIVIKKGDPCQ
ncbi:MAG: hypothetical protein C0614_13855, partial [Desulfuromonas sp.]